MMTAASIGAGQAVDYSAYLESRTVAPARGDYYLSAEGDPVEAPGVWRMRDETLQRLRLEAGEAVRAEQLVALMEGRDPGSGGFIRQAGADGQRAAGIDLTFSAPKSVSAVWALGSDQQRSEIETAHGRAVERALDHLRSDVPVVREGAGGVRLGCARDVLAAEFRHTTARGVEAGAPDPQLHSHVVVTGVVREDGRFAAVASRPLFRAARELGAFYRAALAQELREQGYEILAGTGRDGRYFEIAGIPEGAREALSGRSREVWLAAERFRARYGREPERDELRNVKLENRKAKVPESRPQLQQVWEQRAEKAGLKPADVQALRDAGGVGGVRRVDERPWQQRVTDGLTGERATFTDRELRASVIEQSLGELAPEHATARARELIANGEVIELGDGLMTTREVRGMERAITDHIQEMASDKSAGVSGPSQERALGEVAERLGGPLSVEQQRAVRVLGGGERVAVLIGEAGAGKGVVIDTLARAEQHSGRRVFGVAVSGSTAERLGEDSPALEGRTMTLDSLVARAGAGSLRLEETTVFFDEAGMGDTRRMHKLTQTISQSGGKLVLVGDAGQLPAIGAGGMFKEVEQTAPTVRLKEVRRTQDPAERQAWADLRAGRSEEAMAHYQSRGQLHFADTRDQTVEAAVQQWAEIAEREGTGRVALMSDASTLEIDRMNARAQQLRADRGQLGTQEVQLPDVPYGVRQGDRVAFIAQHHPEGEPRVENGTRGQITNVNPNEQRVSLITDGGRQVTLTGQEELSGLRLGYAQHLYRQQGATVNRAVVVTGGWQTSQEGAYVQASRARHGTDWHVAREDLGTEGLDTERIGRLSEMMRASRAQIASIAYHAIASSREPADTGMDLQRSTARQLQPDRAHSHDAGMSL